MVRLMDSIMVSVRRNIFCFSVSDILDKILRARKIFIVSNKIKGRINPPRRIRKPIDLTNFNTSTSMKVFIILIR